MLYKNTLSLGISSNIWFSTLSAADKESSFEQMLSEAALAGFTGINIKSCCLDSKNNDMLKKLFSLRCLSIAGLSFDICASKTSFDILLPYFKKQLKKALELDIKYLIIREINPNFYRSQTWAFSDRRFLQKNEWEIMCLNLNTLGKLASSHNVQLCLRPSIDSYIYNEEEIFQLLQYTDKNYLNLVLNSGSFANLSCNAIINFITKYVDRIKYIQLTDVNSEKLMKAQENKLSYLNMVKTGCFSVPGDGSVNFKNIFQALNDINYSGWIIVDAEQNLQVGSAFEVALRAYNFLQALLEFRF